MATPSVAWKIPLTKESKEYEHSSNNVGKGSRIHFSSSRQTINSCRFSCSPWCTVCGHQRQSEFSSSRRNGEPEEIVTSYTGDEYDLPSVNGKRNTDSGDMEYEFKKVNPSKQSSHKNVFEFNGEKLIGNSEFNSSAVDRIYSSVSSSCGKKWLSTCASDVQAMYLREVQALRGKLLELQENLPLRAEPSRIGINTGSSKKSPHCAQSLSPTSLDKYGKTRDQKRSRTPPDGKRIRQDDLERYSSATLMAGLKRPRDGSPGNSEENRIAVSLQQRSSTSISPGSKEMCSLFSVSDDDDDSEATQCDFLFRDGTEEEVDVIPDDGADDVARGISDHTLKIADVTLDSDKADSDEEQNGLHPCLRLSLFEKVPPYIKFTSYNTKEKDFPLPIQRILKWRITAITPIVVRKTLVNSGFRMVRKAPDWVGTWGKHMKSLCFRTLDENQKLNHFPGTFQLGRKDRLWKNLYRFLNKYGKKEFGFLPRTYILPQDSRILRSVWEKNGGKAKWIVKPPASARGSGIKVVHKWCQIPKKVPIIVQKYISNPLLINGSKFDLRLYVLVTSYNPLKVYLYEDGLVRFASVKYSDDMNTLADRYMHLTNYSINKLSSQYTQNEDAKVPQGHKWTIKTLWSYLESSVNVEELWANLRELVIKTMIGGEYAISQLAWTNLPSRYCSYELFGVDVLLDENLKPWLLEVNISPSLHSTSPLDLAVKGPMVKDLLNMVGFHIPSNVSATHEEDVKAKLGVKDNYAYDPRMYTMGLSEVEKNKQSYFSDIEDRNLYLDGILDDLTPDDVRHLIQYEDELTQIGGFEKIFPNPSTFRYHKFFESPKYYNMLLDAWEYKYSNNRVEGVELLNSMCRQGIHLDISQVEKRRSQVCSSDSSATNTEDSETEILKPSGRGRKNGNPSSDAANSRCGRFRPGKLSYVMRPYPRYSSIAARRQLRQKP